MKIDNIIKRLNTLTNLPKDLRCTEVVPQGHDHLSFHYGSNYVVRIPSAPEYRTQVLKEKDVLPYLRSKLSLEIPEPIVYIPEDSSFEEPIAIYRWIDGDEVNRSRMDGFVLADELASFLVELRKTPIHTEWKAGPHNFYRGAHPKIYQNEVMSCLEKLPHPKKELYTKIWDEALMSHWEKDNCWVHGDIAVGNLLCKHKHLTAVIDFGSCGLGDPACDYVMAWTYFNPNERTHFFHLLSIDEHTWKRAKGWALWKALISLNQEHLKDWALETLHQLELDEEKKV